MEVTLHPDDIVASKADNNLLGVVERTHLDIDTHSPYPGRGEPDRIVHDKHITTAVFRLFMRDGVPPQNTALVRWQNTPKLELLRVSSVELVDRSLLIGDVVKRNVHDAQSGVILNTFTKCSLQPMCDVVFQNTKIFKGLLPHQNFDATSQFCVYPDGKPSLVTDIPASELEHAEALTEDDLVIYKDWVGKVEAITNNICLRLSDNSVVEIADELGEHPDEDIGSFCIGDIAKTKKGALRTGRWIYGSYNANTPPVGTVVAIRTIGADIAWIQRRIGSTQEEEPHYLLEAPELESADFMVYHRTKRPINSAAQQQSQTLSNSEIDTRLGLRVRFRDLAGARLKYSAPTSHNQITWLDRQSNLGYDLNVFDVCKFETIVSVQWQDLTITTERSIDLVPDSNIDDEHAAWPGEIAHPLGLQPVQGLDNIDAPAKVGVVQSVNAAERMARVRWLPDSYVHYAQDPDDEDAAAPIVASCIKPSQGAEEDVSLYDVEAPAALNVRRGDLVLLSVAPYNTFGNPDILNDRTWLGEIVDTLLDGALVVRLGAAKDVRDVVVRRENCIVAVRPDGTDEGDGWHDHVDEATSIEDDSETEDMDEGWDSDNMLDEEALAIRYEDENGDPMEEDEVEDEDWESADEVGDNMEMEDAKEHVTPPTSHSNTPVLEGQEDTTEEQAMGAEVSTAQPPQYKILSSEAPSDHYYRTSPASSTPTHTKRTQKEHKILSRPTSLPEGVYIRTWESRLDLLRVLIIGPTQTPYENAPFVVDLYLHSGFPNSPPKAHFHSWPSIATIGTLGRVNPNLYEDGKICLSLLGTWEGNKLEGWSASRSTILQVIVSLLGLVLVREPYFNEAGYEALVGDEASKRPSALYSERVFLRAKGFLITALESGRSPGLDDIWDILQWVYRDRRGPMLREATVKNVEEVLERSRKSTEEPDGLTVMSKGACIPLQRVLDRLNELEFPRFAAYRSGDPATWPRREE